ncbi:MAG: class I SAM-dependent methyltransferase [Candidatus Aegiribacteria sp.]|nr:class I SAM-dependent methyltransferase [Candidatus Aegiribacteria sp.]
MKDTNQFHKKNDLLCSIFPWSPIFAKRSNFEAGYFASEEILVKKFLKTKSNILIIGSGNGREARPICQDQHDIYCMDIASIYLEIGQRLFRKIGITNVSFIQDDVCKGFSFKDNSFDFIFCSLYSNMGSFRFQLLRDLHRIIRQHGSILLSCCTPIYPSLYQKDDLSKWKWIKSEEELSAEVSNCSFNLVDSIVDPIRSEYRLSILNIK